MAALLRSYSAKRYGKLKERSASRASPAGAFGGEIQLTSSSAEDQQPSMPEAGASASSGYSTPVARRASQDPERRTSTLGSLKAATPPPKAPLLKLQPSPGGSQPHSRHTTEQEELKASPAKLQTSEVTAPSPAASSHSSVTGEDAELLQRASDAQQHVLELRSRILGLTALNAELTRKIQSGVDETAAIKALKSRNEELQQQLTVCNKEISGLQADLALHERMEQRMMAKVRAAEQALLDGEFHILNSSPLGRAQVERFAALNARIQELEALHGTPAKAGPEAGTKAGKEAAPTRSARPVQSHHIQDLDSELVRQLQLQLRELAAQLEAVSAQLAVASQAAIDEQKRAQDAKAEAKAAAGRATALQEQLDAVRLHLQEALAAKQLSTTPNEEASLTMAELQAENKRLAGLLANAEVAAEDAAQLRDALEAKGEAQVLQEGLLEDAAAKLQRAEQDMAVLQQHLEEERNAAAAARGRSKAAAEQGLAGREELAAARAQMAVLQADLAKARLDAKTATAEAEQHQAELSALQREHGQAQSLHAASLSEIEALHARHASAAQRAEEALAELALVRETQAALTAQAQHSADIHAKQAQQARAELEEVRRAATDSVHASTVSTEQLRELQQLRSRSLAADTPANGNDASALQGRLAEVSAELESLRLSKAEAESLAAVRAEEADDLAARLVEARKQLLEMGASNSSSVPSPLANNEQAKHWLPRAASNAAASAMYPNTRLRTAQGEGAKQSPRMVITPRQVPHNSEEVMLLKAETGTLKDELRTVRGQLASLTSACAAAENRNRQLSSQLSEKTTELAQLREAAERAASNYKMAKAEAEHLKRASEGAEVPSLGLAALQAKLGALAAKHEDALGKLAQAAVAQEAAEAAREAAITEAQTHQQHARNYAIRSEEKQVEIEELRTEVRRGEQRLRTANRDMKSMQDKAELHSKFSSQYLAELEALRTQRSSPDKPRGRSLPSANGNAEVSREATEEDSALQQEVSRLREENAALAQQVKSYEADVANLISLGGIGHQGSWQKKQQQA